jgi:serine/threonine-protein kinase
MGFTPSRSVTDTALSPSLQPNLILGDRYHILRELGQGGFGRTYLAEDLNRFNESCVLKEFAPQVQGEDALAKAQDLFTREAGVLYRLEHPQIPRFRELFRTEAAGRGLLLLVQDYVCGRDYRELLDERLAQGQTFSEAEGLNLLRQLLPVLAYLHSVGVIHRDIAPDNIIRRDSDGLPVLIDFGGVKQVAAEVLSQLRGFPKPTTATRLGKVGYAPGEQMQQGTAYPHSDLYALAATVLALVTGQEPQALVNPQTLEWHWRNYVNLDERLGAVLDKMLALRPGDRYASAEAVLEALSELPGPTPTVNPAAAAPSASPTIVIVPTGSAPASAARADAAPTGAAVAPLPSVRAIAPAEEMEDSFNRWWWVLLVTFLLLLAVGGGWFLARNWVIRQFSNRPGLPPASTQLTPSDAPPKTTPQHEQIQARLQAMEINPDFFESLVRFTFSQRYPDRQGRPPGNSPEEAAFRAAWDDIARQWIGRLEVLPNGVRANLGRYGDGDLQSWINEAERRSVSKAAFYDLVDSAFGFLAPDLQGQDYLGTPVGQIWLALGAKAIGTIQNGSTLESLALPPDQDVSEGNTLVPGEGRIYVVDLQAGKQLRLAINASPSIRVSVFAPSARGGALLKDSSRRDWTSGPLSQPGLYQIVVTSQAAAPEGFAMSLRQEIIATAPASPASTSASPTDNSPATTPSTGNSPVPATLPTDSSPAASSSSQPAPTTSTSPAPISPAPTAPSAPTPTPTAPPPEPTAPPGSN